MLLRNQSQFSIQTALSLEETLTAAMLLLLNTLILMFPGFHGARTIFMINVTMLIMIAAASGADRMVHPVWLSPVRDWYAVPMMITIYMEHNILVPLVNPHDLDNLFIAMDRYLFGGYDPTVLMEKISFPALSELLQIVYASFYFFPFTLCLIVYLKNRESFHLIASTILLGFYISYVGYYIFPAIGPRFTLEHLHHAPLSGLYSFDGIRNLLSTLEGVTRDCFPSGHTLVAVLTLMLARQHTGKFRMAAWPWCVLLIMATVYLRYHYVVDAIAGLALALIAYRAGPRLFSWHSRRRGALRVNAHHGSASIQS